MESRVNLMMVATGVMDMQTVAQAEFKDFNLREEHVEELINKGVLFGEDDSVLIVGRQFCCSNDCGRSDLIGLNSAGELIIIEVKRDKSDVSARSEAFEMQAIRYAAGLSEITTQEELVDTMFAAYCKKYAAECKDMDAQQLRDYALGRVRDLVGDNTSINGNQRLMLVASGFDTATLLACDWLYRRQIDISCTQISPFGNGDNSILLVVDRIFPPDTLKELAARARGKRSLKTKLPTTFDLISSGKIRQGQTVYIKGKVQDGVPQTAIVIDDVYVEAGGIRKRWNEWVKEAKKLNAVSIYHHVVVEPSGQTLHELRMLSA